MLIFCSFQHEIVRPYPTCWFKPDGGFSFKGRGRFHTRIDHYYKENLQGLSGSVGNILQFFKGLPGLSINVALVLRLKKIFNFTS